MLKNQNKNLKFKIASEFVGVISTVHSLCVTEMLHKQPNTQQ